jgi:hypothetical protein
VAIAAEVVRCAQDNPVHPRTEGNLQFPNEGAIAPWPLGVKKEATRRLYQNTKHSKSTIQLRDSTATPSKYLREIWARFWAVILSFCSCALFFACVRVIAAIVLLCVCSYSLPYSGFDCDRLCKAWETPTCGDSSQTGPRSFYARVMGELDMLSSMSHFLVMVGRISNLNLPSMQWSSPSNNCLGWNMCFPSHDPRWPFFLERFGQIGEVALWLPLSVNGFQKGGQQGLRLRQPHHVRDGLLAMGGHHTHRLVFKGSAKTCVAPYVGLLWDFVALDPTRRPQHKPMTFGVCCVGQQTELHGIQGSRWWPPSSFSFDYRQSRMGCYLPFESKGRQCSNSIGQPHSSYLKESMRMYSSFVIG